VKPIRTWYASLVLLAPFLLMLGLMFAPSGCGSSGGGSTPMATQGSIELGFVDSPTNGYQQIALNVVSVRFNPSTDPNVPDSDPNWYTIPAPGGAGAAGELALDLTTIQNNVQVFNTVSTAAQVYYQVELVLDPNVPGTIVPSCAQGTSPIEGCVSYPLTVSGSTNIRTTVSAGISVTANALTPVVLDVSPGTIVPPSAPGGFYTVSPTILPVSNTLLANITGTITINGGSLAGPQVITAELTGTTQIIASSFTVPNGNSATFSLQVPATAQGTTYDLFVSGGSASIASYQGLTVTRGVAPPPISFTVQANPGFNVIAGTITDQPSGAPVAGGTVSVLQAPVNDSGANCETTPSACVAILAAATNEQGQFSISNVPFGSYAVQAQNTGNATQVSSITVAAPAASCQVSPNNGCTMALAGTYINGTIALNPPPAAGTNTLVTVLAEQTGTNIIAGLTQVVVPGGFTSMPFQVEVPSTGQAYDLIGSAHDSYLGAATQYPGHQFAVVSGATPNASPAPSPALQIGCVGHGTIVGQALASDSGTRVYLSKVDPNANKLVQLMATSVGPTQNGQGQPNQWANQFSFCAPPDTYVVQRFEATQGASSQATANPVGTPTTVVVPQPSPTSSPCPSICGSSSSCPGICAATQMNAL
jgi:hypothetical protein